MDTLELDRLIEKRAAQLREEAEGEQRVEDLFTETTRRQREKRRENREAWHSHEMHMCELHAALSEEHRVKAERLLEQGEGAA